VIETQTTGSLFVNGCLQIIAAHFVSFPSTGIKVVRPEKNMRVIDPNHYYGYYWKGSK
jgi:hypothetical protein